MKIIQVTPGLIPIPPNGWGAVEKIIWEYHQNSLKLGHDSHITFLDDVPDDADIVHIHVANLANMAYERGIPYYFTMHDHHAYLSGKDSWIYKQNLLAMQRSIKSFVPARYLIEYFDGIPTYFSHGVNTEYFTPSERTSHSLLCVANNGYAHDQTIDRKGFGIAIEVAKILNLPITIAGPSNNKNYFEKYPPQYEGLKILYNLNEEELLTEYKKHSIFLHPSELEAGHPNLTLLEALACGLPIVGTIEEKTNLDGMYIVDRNVQNVILGIKHVLNDYTTYTRNARQQAEKLNWTNRTKELLHIYQEPQTMRDQLLKHYNNTKQLNKSPMFKTSYHNIDGMFTEITGGPDVSYEVSFINKTTNQTVYSVEMRRGHWAKTSTKYYIDWKVRIRNKNSGDVVEHDLDLKGKKVLIGFESKSLGDTLAWIPYVEEFRKKHQCKVVCSTFWNHLFRDVYPEITFVEPGTTEHNLAALYRIGLFYKEDGNVDWELHPTHPIQGPLQKVAADILGLEFKEIRPKMKQDKTVKKEKQVCIAVHSTAQTKYWNNPLGWQEVVNWLNNKGYTVKLLSSEENGYMGNRDPSGVIKFPKSPIEDIINELNKSHAFIGISSGLSWVSWATGIPTVLISGFTDPINEMQDCVRISAPKGKCSGCWHRHKFNPGDWNWCPDHKGTTRQFECSREITSTTVIEQLEKILTDDTSEVKRYAGAVKSFNMIDVVGGNPTNKLTTTDEDFWNGIYDNNRYGWWGTESKSGEGSEGRFAEYKKNLIEHIIKTYDVKSIIDFGCGDFNWMNRVQGVQNYLGVDIVKTLIDEHNKNYGTDTRKFVYGNTANVRFHTDFIRENNINYDMGILFDILGHQLWDEIENTLDFILNKLNLKYILATSQPNCNPNYWKEKESRNESVNLEIHPLMLSRGFEIVEKFEHDLILYRL